MTPHPRAGAAAPTRGGTSSSSTVVDDDDDNAKTTTHNNKQRNDNAATAAAANTATKIQEDAPWHKAMTRSMASFGTWFVSEYPKLILQQQQAATKGVNKFPLVSALNTYQSTSASNHFRGALSSAAQRGSSACIMFYGQSYISHSLLYTLQKEKNEPPTPGTVAMTAGLAGLLGGGASSLIHTLFEPIKIRHEPLTANIYRASLWPMMWRHALFDGTFFATSACLEQYNQNPQNSYQFGYATIFGVSALCASTINLTHDLWKTQYIQALPSSSPSSSSSLQQQLAPRLKWRTVVQSLTRQTFRQQWTMKAFDLGFNWWVTGLLYAALFATTASTTTTR